MEEKAREKTVLLDLDKPYKKEIVEENGIMGEKCMIRPGYSNTSSDKRYALSFLPETTIWDTTTCKFPPPTDNI